MDELNHNPQPPKTRHVRLILDHSAFVRGYGNIRRWFDDEYAAKNTTDASPRILHMYIPSETLRQFRQTKHGVSMEATNTREAMSFIDLLSDKKVSCSMAYEVIIGHEKQGPSWDRCLREQVQKPTIPDTITMAADEFELAPLAAPAVPRSIRQLVRACLYNTKRSPDWRLVTEDPHVREWASSFGVLCLNVNEAEALIFRGKDLSEFGPVDHYNEHRSDILHTTVDTSRYGGKRKERFDEINFAPRGPGKLWQPKTK